MRWSYPLYINLTTFFYTNKTVSTSLRLGKQSCRLAASGRIVRKYGILCFVDKSLNIYKFCSKYARGILVCRYARASVGRRLPAILEVTHVILNHYHSTTTIYHYHPTTTISYAKKFLLPDQVLYHSIEHKNSSKAHSFSFAGDVREFMQCSCLRTIASLLPHALHSGKKKLAKQGPRKGFVQG